MTSAKPTKMMPNLSITISMMVHVLLRCSWITNGELNVSGQETGYCEDASGCNEPSRPPPVLGWQPFVTEPAKTRWIDFSKVMKVYAKWHNRTLYDATISCDEKQVLVFTPNAGLGDSVGALTSAFILAIKQGRMFFIDWKPHKWSIGIKPLPFVYEYNKASALNDDHGNPLICIPRAEWAASNIQGHVTQEHPSLSNPTINSLNVPYDNLLTSVLKPSKKVKAIIDQVLPDAPGHTDVAIVIRTGLAEYNQFLSPGDENNFVACFKNYVKMEQKRRPGASLKYRVFLASDNDDVKTNVLHAMEDFQASQLEVSIQLLVLNDSIIHIMHPGSNPNSQKVANKIRKTFAEFFIISRCKVLFLTHGSLFGRTASELGKTSENNVHFISDSNCDGTREKYSYLSCHTPKYPKICGFT